MQPHTTPFIQNLGKLGIQANLRVVDPAQLKSRTEAFDYDVVTEALPGSTTPGVGLRVVFSSAAAAQNGSRNLAGVADPAVDALIETIASAKSREELNAACRALDRVLRAGHYWVPMWYRDTAWVAYWDAFSRPEQQPQAQHRRAGNLVVGRRKGQDYWTVMAAWFRLTPPPPQRRLTAPCSPISFAASC